MVGGQGDGGGVRGGGDIGVVGNRGGRGQGWWGSRHVEGKKVVGVGWGIGVVGV